MKKSKNKTDFFEKIFKNFIINSTLYINKCEELNFCEIECQKKERRIETLKKNLNSEKKSRFKAILSGQNVVREKVEENLNLREELKKLKDEILILTESNNTLIEKLNSSEEKLVSLQRANEFLRNNRRSPSLEELKNYEENRKKLLKQEK